MAPTIDPQEALEGIFLDWSSLLLTLFVLGVGYVGFVFFCHKRGVNIFEIPLYDKIVRSSIIGFLSISLVVSFLGKDISKPEDIILLISQTSWALFLLTMGVSVLLAYIIYFLFYIYPEIQLVIEYKSKEKSMSKTKKQKNE